MLSGFYKASTRNPESKALSMHLRKSKQIITKLFAQPVDIKSSLAPVWIQLGYFISLEKTRSKKTLLTQWITSLPSRKDAKKGRKRASEQFEIQVKVSAAKIQFARRISMISTDSSTFVQAKSMLLLPTLYHFYSDLDKRLLGVFFIF